MGRLPKCLRLRRRWQRCGKRRDELSPTDREARAVLEAVVERLDRGELRTAEINTAGEVVVHEWVKQAILMLFRVREMTVAEVGPFEFVDKLPLKSGFAAAGVRAVPGSSARWGSFLDRGVVLMPSYVNIGARVGPGTMVDTWATVGSCRAGRRERPPVGWGGHRRGARAAAGSPRGDRGRCDDRQPLNGRRGRQGRCRGGGGSGSHPVCHDPGYRRGDRRGALTRSCAPVVRSRCRQLASASSPAARLASRACWSSSAFPRGSATTSRLCRTSCDLTDRLRSSTSRRSEILS